MNYYLLLFIVLPDMHNDKIKIKKAKHDHNKRNICLTTCIILATDITDTCLERFFLNLNNICDCNFIEPFLFGFRYQYHDSISIQKKKKKKPFIYYVFFSMLIQ